jgi:hypothetical protein
MRRTLRPNIAIILAIFFVFLGVSYCKNYTPSPADFTIVYSNDLLGETEPCG